MAVNDNGHLLDDAGNVAVDFVWGNMPMQPNDVRTTRLNATLDDHIRALSEWNGFPGYTPNDPGSDILGPTDYVSVPNVLGLTEAIATDVLQDYGLGTVTVAESTANASGFKATINNVAIASGTATFTTSAAHGFTGYPNAQTVTISGLTTTQLNGTWLISNASGSTFTVFNTSFTNVSSTSDSGTVVDTSKIGKVKAQSIAAAASSVAPGTAITITLFDN